MNLRVAVLQRVLPAYRLRVFDKLQRENHWNVRCLIGEDLPDSKVRSASSFSGLDVVKLPTSYLKIGQQVLTNHKGLCNALNIFQPDVIVCEGESNLLSYLKAVMYRIKRRHVPLVHWSLGEIPGRKARTSDWVRNSAKKGLLSLFDAFIVYSSFGKKALVNLGCKEEEVFVAVNVGDVESALKNVQRLEMEAERFRLDMGLGTEFVFLYVGSMEPEKRLDVLLEAMTRLKKERLRLVIVGGGEQEIELQSKAKILGLDKVHFCGYANGDALAKHYLSCDAFVLPGRGGMVLSEAMAYGLPTVVYKADGTEFDLIKHGNNGLHLQIGDAEDIANALSRLSSDSEASKKMGQCGRELVQNEYNLNRMVKNVTDSVEYALAKRTVR
jgi:glycosyltransferase involved in cell wall biosynthesis